MDAIIDEIDKKEKDFLKSVSAEIVSKVISSSLEIVVKNKNCQHCDIKKKDNKKK